MVVLEQTAPLGRHFQSGLRTFPPRAESFRPWAILCDHFMVKKPRPSINHQLLNITSASSLNRAFGFTIEFVREGLR